jgi:hypothetical protein
MMSSGREDTHGGMHDATFVTQLQPNDVLMGRGAPITDNIGNRRFLDLVREKCTGYQQAATRKEKDATARQIVSIIHARGGLFLRKIDSPEEATHLGVPHHVETAWTAADEKTVLLKIKQALRDRSLEVRERDPASTQEHALETTEAHTEELGADEMVAAGLLSSSQHAAPQPERQDPLAKRAKTESLQDSSASRDDSSTQAPPAPGGLIMSAPADVANTRVNRFQGASASDRNMLNLQLPLRTSNFSQAARYRPGGAEGYNYSQQLPIAPARLSIGHDWSLPMPGVAGLNLQRAISIDLPGGSEHGRLLGNLQRQSNSANSLAQAANLLQQQTVDESHNEAAITKETSAEIALQIACEVCEKSQRETGGAGSAAAAAAAGGVAGGAGTGVNLDPIELCLLTVLCSRGLPTWSSTQFHANGDILAIASGTEDTAATSGENTTPTVPFALTWTHVGRQLVQEVENFLSRKTNKLFPHDPPTLRGLAIAGFVSRLVSMAVSYSKNPTSLARMAIMLLEKLRRHSQLAPFLPFATTTGASSNDFAPPLPSFGRSISESSRGGLGVGFAARAEQQRAAVASAVAVAASTTSRQQPGGGAGGEFLFQGFLTTELRRWATSLKIADEVGFPVPFSSSEFATVNRGGQVHDVFSTAAVFDAIGCQAILHQASFLTRLRSLMQTHSSDQVLDTLRTFSSQQTTPATRWGVTFVESAVLDLSLIKALLTGGFSGLTNIAASSSTNTDDLLRTLLQHSSIHKGDVEKQVVQLTCLLHRHFQSKKIHQVTSQQAANLVEMMTTR